MWHEVDWEAVAEEQGGPTDMTPAELEEYVVFERLHRYNKAQPCGAKVLAELFRDRGVTPDAQAYRLL